MQDPHVDALDLRSLRFLARLLETGSVTRAGEACGLSQPTASRTLGRLRDALGDPLLVRGQQGHVFTPRAESLRTWVTEAEGAVGLVFAQDSFDPATTTRAFRVGVTEYAMATIMSELMRRVRAQAPQAMVQFRASGPGSFDALEAGELDLTLIAIYEPPEHFRSQKLFHEHLVGVVSADHPLARTAAEGGVTLDAYLSHDHVALTPGAPGPNPVDDALQALGRSRRIAFTVAHFSAMWALAGTDLVMSVPSRMAGLARERGLATFALPLDLAGFDYALVWHQRSEGDPALDWLRGLVLDSTPAEGRAAPPPAAGAPDPRKTGRKA